MAIRQVYLLIHLTETWRTALDSGSLVAVAYFRKAFDISDEAKKRFYITGMLLDFLKCYLSERRQFTLLNGTKSDMLWVSIGISYGSVLGPTLVTVSTNELQTSVHLGSLYMFADDTTVFCIGDSPDMAIAHGCT